jgi:hypothetical protein
VEHHLRSEFEVGLDVIYRKGRSWTELRRSVGLETRPLAPGEDGALANLCKLTHVGDSLRLETWKQLIRLERPRGPLETRVQNTYPMPPELVRVGRIAT